MSFGCHVKVGIWGHVMPLYILKDIPRMIKTIFWKNIMQQCYKLGNLHLEHKHRDENLFLHHTIAMGIIFWVQTETAAIHFLLMWKKNCKKKQVT
jgi:hypothetical protein